MKKIILVIMMLVLLATVANAASINGDFEGNPIIKITSSGKIIPVEDVPAILYKGRTMVPIGMLRQLGATVSWEQKTNSVDVILPTQFIPKLVEPTTDVSAVSWMKYYAGVADAYKFLGDIGDTMYILSTTFLNTMNEISLNKNSTSPINKASASLNESSEFISQNLGYLSSIEKWMIDNKETSYISAILNGYIDAIEHFEFSLSAMNTYSSTSSQSSTDDFFNHSINALDKIRESFDKSGEEYTNYINKIKNYE